MPGPAGQANRRLRHRRKVDRLESGALGEQGVVGVDSADDLQGDSALGAARKAAPGGRDISFPSTPHCVGAQRGITRLSTFADFTSQALIQ